MDVTNGGGGGSSSGSGSDGIIARWMQIRARLTHSAICRMCVRLCLLWTQRGYKCDEMNNQLMHARPVYHFECDINYFVNENICSVDCSAFGNRPTNAGVCVREPTSYA